MGQNESDCCNSPGKAVSGGESCCSQPQVGKSGAPGSQIFNGGRTAMAFLPHADLVETGKGYRLELDVPGASKDGLDISVEKNILSVRAQVRHPAFEGFRLEHQEYKVGDYFRQFSVSDDIEVSAIEAAIKDGVLTIMLPKSAKAVTRKIEVRAV